MTIRVGINGFGRIGRSIFRACGRDRAFAGIEIVAINDLTDKTTLAHLLKYDSVMGIYGPEVKAGEKGITIDGRPVEIRNHRDPADIPWGDLGVDYVIEATGYFTHSDTASAHLAAGAGKVVISAPAKGEVKTIVMGVNEDEYDAATHHIVSNASCTTNCLAPVAKVILDRFGIKSGLMTTVHAYTNDQRLLDFPHSDLRRARAAAMSIIPTTTGAAKATALVIPEVKGKIDGVALRVPTCDVSVVDLTCIVNKATSIEEINATFTKAAAAGPLQGVLAVSDEPLVSVDYIGDMHSSTVDLPSTNVIDGTFVHVSSWYDNEMGYSARCVDLLAYMAARL